MDKFLSFKKAVVQIRGPNTLHHTFVYSVAVGLFTKADIKNRGRITKKLKQFTKETFIKITLDFNLNIEEFEEQNDVSIIVFGYNPNTNIIFCKKPIKNVFNKVVSILQLPDDTYAYINDLSRLLSKQVSFTKHKRYICEYCLKNFGIKDKKIKNHLCVVGLKIPMCLKE